MCLLNRKSQRITLDLFKRSNFLIHFDSLIIFSACALIVPEQSLTPSNLGRMLLFLFPLHTVLSAKIMPCCQIEQPFETITFTQFSTALALFSPQASLKLCTLLYSARKKKK